MSLCVCIFVLHGDYDKYDNDSDVFHSWFDELMIIWIDDSMMSVSMVWFSLKRYGRPWRVWCSESTKTPWFGPLFWFKHVWNWTWDRPTTSCDEVIISQWPSSQASSKQFRGFQVTQIFLKKIRTGWAAVAEHAFPRAGHFFQALALAVMSSALGGWIWWVAPMGRQHFQRWGISLDGWISWSRYHHPIIIQSAVHCSNFPGR